MWKVAAVSAAVALASAAYAYHQRETVHRLSDELTRAEQTIAAQKRLQHADTSRCDPDDDTRWLLERAGR